MLHPSYKEMINKINDTANSEDMEITSRYSLVIAAAKRARQINSGSEPLVPAKMKEKNLSVAVDELFAGKVHILNEDEAAEEAAEEEISEAEGDAEETGEELSGEKEAAEVITDEAPENENEPEDEIPEEETAPEDSDQ